ncbi:MAG: aldehyde dehydrogenase [Bacteroidales bacterium]|nr:aldehyde dehydrogenase [Bacteroidales bacterium]
MEANPFEELFERQQKFFLTGRTLDFAFRKDVLRKLKSTILEHENDFYDTLFQDLHKSKFESYATEIGFVLEELSFNLKKLKKWMRPKKVSSGIVSFPAKSRITHEPVGTVLIIAPWNYPFQLMIAPLIGAIAAGNTVILKPSEISEHTGLAIKRIINAAFDEDYIHVVTGGSEVSQQLLTLNFNHIFFTGSPRVGKVVMQAAAKNLIPVTLELGGKSPCIVNKDVNLKLAARRIAWGKFLNAGQTCIAPDYLLVHEDIKDALIKELESSVHQFFGKDIRQSPDYPRIISRPNMERLATLLEGVNVVLGGNYDICERYFEPTLLDDVDFEKPVMQQEIFGPILPIITFNNIEEAISMVNNRPRPLALYVFAKSKKFQDKIILAIPAGGVTVNDTLMHIASNTLPFGGVGNSGIGKYHGFESFRTFSNIKPVVYRGRWIDVPIRYAPYGSKLKIIKYLMH